MLCYSSICIKNMKTYDKNKESSFLKYWDVNDLNGWAMSLACRWF